MKTIRISDESHARLTKRGIYGDSMEDIIKRILDSLDKLEAQIKSLEEKVKRSSKK